MIKDALEFYYLASELKDMLRQGAVQWGVKKERLESIAEHTYGCMILAISLQPEIIGGGNLDLGKTLEMLTIHELEEIAIGDVTPLSKIDKTSLKTEARKAVYDFVKNLTNGDRLMVLTDEYNEAISKEAKFAKAIDKLECVLEFKKYQDLGQVSLAHLKPEMLRNKKVKELVDSGKYDLADIFFLYHMPAYKDFGINEEFWFKKIKPLKINREKNIFLNK